MPQILRKDQIKLSPYKRAKAYEEAAVLQHEVAERLLERLNYMRIQPLRVLDVGAATGYCSQRLEKHYPQAKVIALDPSLDLLNFYQKKWWQKKPLRMGSQLESIALANHSVDLIFSNLSLAALADPQACFRELHRVLRPGGLLLFSTLGPDTLKELQASFAGLDTYRHVQEFIDMHHIGDALLATAWQDPVVDMEFITMTYPGVDDLIYDLRITGAKNTHPQRCPYLMPPTRWRVAQKNYELLRLDNQQLPATFEIIYGHAWKAEDEPLARMNEKGEIAISVQSIPVKRK